LYNVDFQYLHGKEDGQFKQSKGDESPAEYRWTTGDGRDDEDPQIQSGTSGLNGWNNADTMATILRMN
jgi:hypothetical protein